MLSEKLQGMLDPATGGVDLYAFQRLTEAERTSLNLYWRQRRAAVIDDEADDEVPSSAGTLSPPGVDKAVIEALHRTLPDTGSCPVAAAAAEALPANGLELRKFLWPKWQAASPELRADYQGKFDWFVASERTAADREMRRAKRRQEFGEGTEDAIRRHEGRSSGAAQRAREREEFESGDEAALQRAAARGDETAKRLLGQG